MKTGPRGEGCPQSLDLTSKKLFLLDMDGTLYLGEQVLPGARAFLEKIRERGARAIFLTNNSSRGIEGYLQKMRRLGLPAEERDFLTSTDATIHVLQTEYPGCRCFVMGTRSFCDQLESAGISFTERYEEGVELVLLSNDTELHFGKLRDASRLLLEGEPVYLATNPDWVCPCEFGSVPDCGSFAQMLEHVCGRLPRVIGKPQPDVVRLAMARCGVRPEETVIVGDRIYTDVACGVNAGIDSVFVLSGEGTREDIVRFGITPTAVYRSVKELAEEL